MPARFVHNPNVVPKPNRGFQFELEVFDALRAGLPESYVILHQAVISARDRAAPAPQRARPAEVDLLVVGPNGVFLIEAKVREIVEGDLWGPWTYRRRQPRPGERTVSYDRSMAMKMKINLEGADKRVAARSEDERRDFFPYDRNATGFFVFPDDAEVAITDDGRPGEVFEEGMLRIARLRDLCARIQDVPPPRVKPGRPPLSPLSAEDALTIVGYFEKGRRPTPDISGPLRLEEPDHHYRTAANGLPFAVHALQDELGQRFRGKWYDMSALANNRRVEFEEQVRRHARVSKSVGRDPNVLPYVMFFRDDVGGGFWVIEADVDADPLEDRLRVGPPLNARDVSRDVAKGIKAVHTAGFVCRDLDPASILVERTTGATMLAGFEVAKANDGSPTVIADGSELAGSPYCSPEARRGAHDVDARADLFSWAALTFHLVTGEVLEREDQLPLVDGKVPPAVAALLRSCLAVYPQDRPANIDAVLATFKSWR